MSFIITVFQLFFSSFYYRYYNIYLSFFNLFYIRLETGNLTNVCNNTILCQKFFRILHEEEMFFFFLTSPIVKKKKVRYFHSKKVQNKNNTKWNKDQSYLFHQRDDLKKVKWNMWHIRKSFSQDLTFLENQIFKILEIF